MFSDRDLLGVGVSSLIENRCLLKLEEGGLSCLIDLGAQTDLLEQSRHGMLPSNRNNRMEQAGVVEEKQRWGGQMASSRLPGVSFEVFDAAGGLRKLSKVLVTLLLFIDRYFFFFLLCADSTSLLI